jgi:carbonic anhydrase
MEKRNFGEPVPLPSQLVDGYRAFLAGGLRAEQDRYRELAHSGQSPEVMVIGCCDSRCSPEVIFNSRPGELFVVRNIANLVPPYAPDAQAHGVSAALEFGVMALMVKHIVVLGHAQCGGIKAFAEDAEPLTPGDFIGNWMKLMTPAAGKIGPRGSRPMDEYLTLLEQANVALSLDNLMTSRACGPRSSAATSDCTAPILAWPPANFRCETRQAENSRK